MKNMKRLLENLMIEDYGQDLAAALIGLGAVVAMKGLKNSIGTTFNSIGTSLSGAV